MCDIVEEKDDEGTVLRTKMYQGRYYVNLFIGNVKDHLEHIKSMDVRDDDIFVLAYPKAGTHWVANICSMLLKGNTTYLGSPHFLDFNIMETLNHLSSPRIFASHLTFDFMPRQLQEGKGKVIVIFRNPKDAAVSLYEFLMSVTQSNIKGSWNGFIKFFIDGKTVYGSWFDTLSEWEETQRTYKGNNILYLKYEEMKMDLNGHVATISSFLGERHDRQFIDNVAKKCTFESMKVSVLEEIEPDDLWKGVTRTKKLPIYRKGEVGNWKNHFTVAQNEYFDKVYQEKNDKFEV